MGVGVDQVEPAAAPLEVLRDLWLMLGREGKAGDPTSWNRDLTARQLSIYLFVYLEPGRHTIRGLAERLQTRKPSVTRSVDRLEMLDLVVRRPDPGDRRSVLVWRTRAGLKMLRGMQDCLPSQVVIDGKAWTIEARPTAPARPRPASPAGSPGGSTQGRSLAGPPSPSSPGDAAPAPPRRRRKISPA